MQLVYILLIKETLISMVSLENDMTVLSGDLITPLLLSAPFMLVHNSASLEFFFYITCLNEE